MTKSNLQNKTAETEGGIGTEPSSKNNLLFKRVMLIIFSLSISILIPGMLAWNLFRENQLDDFWGLVIPPFVGGNAILAYFWFKKPQKNENLNTVPDEYISNIKSGRLVEISIEEYSEVYNQSIESIVDFIKNKNLIGQEVDSKWRIAVNPESYRIDVSEQPKIRTEIQRITGSDGVWFVLVNLAFMLINIASVGIYFWIRKKESESAYLFIPFVLTFPVWIYSLSSGTAGKVYHWKILFLKWSRAYMKVFSFLIGALTIYFGVTFIFDEFKSIDLKTLGVIIVFLLGVVIYNQSRQNKE